MAELTDDTCFPSSAHPFRAQPGLATNDLINMLKQILQRVVADNGSPQLAGFAQRALAEMERIQAANGLTTISEFVAHTFHLSHDDLKSRSRAQRTTFCRHVAMHLCRRIPGNTFATIGTHFDRDHSTCIHAVSLIERRMQRDVAFRLFIEQLEGQITGTLPATTEGAASSVVIRTRYGASALSSRVDTTGVSRLTT